MSSPSSLTMNNLTVKSFSELHNVMIDSPGDKEYLIPLKSDVTFSLLTKSIFPNENAVFVAHTVKGLHFWLADVAGVRELGDADEIMEVPLGECIMVRRAALVTATLEAVDIMPCLERASVQVLWPPLCVMGVLTAIMLWWG